jgi:hypothetical protein
MILGQVDRGAEVTWCSQYPGESEILFPPLSNLEVVGEMRTMQTEKGLVNLVKLRINANIKSLTVDELVSRRKTLHLAALSNLLEETQRDLDELEKKVCVYMYNAYMCICICMYVQYILRPN